MTDVPALTKQLEAGQGCSAASAIWESEDRHALLGQIAAQNQNDHRLDSHVPLLVISEGKDGLEIDIPTGAGNRQVLKLGAKQEGATCNGGALDKDIYDREVKDPTVPDTRLSFDTSIKDSPFQRGDTGAYSEQFNTPAQRLVFKNMSKDASDDDKVAALQAYLKRTMPHASEDERNRAFDRYLSPPISNQMPLGIFQVPPGTPAQKAGLKVGDVVKSVNGVDLNGKSYVDAAASISGTPGSAVTLVIERNENGKPVELTRQIVRVDPNPSTIPDVNAANFHQEVENSKVPVFIDVKADWCLPCREMAPMLEELQKEYEGRVKFVRIDTDKDSPGLISTPENGTSLTYPTLALYNPATGQTPAFVGARDKASLEKFIDQQLAYASTGR
jgi:thioredoxin 1